MEFLWRKNKFLQLIVFWWYTCKRLMPHGELNITKSILEKINGCCVPSTVFIWVEIEFLLRVEKQRILNFVLYLEAGGTRKKNTTEP